MPNLIKIEAADATELASILLDLTSNQFKDVFYMHCDHEQPTLMKRVIGSSMLYQDALDTTSFFVMTDIQKSCSSKLMFTHVSLI